MELGGPEVGRGCGGRGIIHGFELLEKLGFHEWGFDYVLLDFLGDVVCGGFGLPIARDMCQKVIVVGSNDLQSLYVANNVCSAVEYFRKLGGNVGVGGLVINKDDGTGEAQAFAEAVGIPILASIPADDDIRRKSANYEIIGKPDSQWGDLFAELAANGIRFNIIGDRGRLPPDTVKLIESAEARTAANTTMALTIALSYGSRQEIAAAARALAADCAAGAIKAEDITEDSFAQRLFTAGTPDPDLLIRTSGEQRISNFLLWQLAYSELVFTETLWPDFGQEELEDAIATYRSRERRYGAVTN
jgi:hypothetical protein